MNEYDDKKNKSKQEWENSNQVRRREQKTNYNYDKKAHKLHAMLGILLHWNKLLASACYFTHTLCLSQWLLQKFEILQ